MIGAVLPSDQEWTQGCDCDAQLDVAQPVNTRSGNYWTRVTDLALVSRGPTLQWTRTYASQALTATLSGLSPGWQQPYASRVITPGAPGGEAGIVSVLSPELNRLRFTELGGGQYAAWEGVYSTLVQANGRYTQTLRTQEQYSFDAQSGRLLSVRDAQGRELSLSYNASGQLIEVADAATPTRKLTLSYDGAGHRA